MFMNKFLTLAAVAALFAAYNASPALANDQAYGQEEELAYAHEGDKAEMKGEMHKKGKEMKKPAAKHEVKKGKAYKTDEQYHHHSDKRHHKDFKHKPHHTHNYYTDEQK
jgi:hypothetical protein